jgi:hypothetical protein
LYTFTLDTELSHTVGFELNANTGKLRDSSVLLNNGTLMKEVTRRLAENRQSQMLILYQNSYDIMLQTVKKTLVVTG